jgi:hypothetical protein
MIDFLSLRLKVVKLRRDRYLIVLLLPERLVLPMDPIQLCGDERRSSFMVRGVRIMSVIAIVAEAVEDGGATLPTLTMQNSALAMVWNWIRHLQRRRRVVYSVVERRRRIAGLSVRMHVEVLQFQMANMLETRWELVTRKRRRKKAKSSVVRREVMA